MFVKPAPGLKVRNPVTKRHLPLEGAEVPESTYWVRRLAAGDVVQASDVQTTDSSSIESAQGEE
jgi:hypothetical protein